MRMKRGMKSTQRQVRLFRNGRSQILCIPRDVELPGDQAILRREGNCLIIEPVARPSLLSVLGGLKPLAEEFPAMESRPAEPVEL